jgi:hypothetical protein
MFVWHTGVVGLDAAANKLQAGQRKDPLLGDEQYMSFLDYRDMQGSRSHLLGHPFEEPPGRAVSEG